MTNWPTYKFDHSFAELDKFSKFFVGADKIAQKMNETFEHIQKTAGTAYPPFNLKKTDENVYVVELAVAGFGKQDIELTLEDNKLVIKGNTSVDSEEALNTDYLHKGIADRAFTRTFSLADNVVVNNAAMMNGILKIWLEHIIPEDKKAKKIDIADAEEPVVKKSSKQKFLAE
jgi:molecular chaperone IbpA